MAGLLLHGLPRVRQLRVPGNRRNDVRLVVNLKDIGTLLDVNGALNPSLF